MKTISVFSSLVLAFLLGFTSGCSKDEGNSVEDIRQHLGFVVNGEKLNIDIDKSFVTCKKEPTSYGSINLVLKVLSEDGRTIEFQVFNYFGNQHYPVGLHNFTTGGNYMNANWLSYSEMFPEEGIWSSLYEEFHTGNIFNSIEITEDNGSYITGNFAFEGHEATGITSRMISQGSFHIKLSGRN